MSQLVCNILDSYCVHCCVSSDIVPVNIDRFISPANTRPNYLYNNHRNEARLRHTYHMISFISCQMMSETKKIT